MITTLVLSACLSAQIVVEPLTPFPVIPDVKEKAAVPKDAEAGMKRVREVAGAALTGAKTPAEKVDLAMRLVTLAVETTDDANTRWAALSEGARLAAEADPLVAFWIVDAQDKLFDIDLGKQRLKLLGKVPQSGPVPQLQAAAKGAQVACREAELSAKAPEVYDTVQALAEFAADLAAKAKDPAARDVQKFRDNVKLYRKEFEEALAAKSKLESAPDDVEANRTWGKHLALHRLDWDKGLPALAKSDGPLAEAAQADQARQEKPEDQEATANRWWKLADTDKTLSPRDTSALQTRAGVWYRKAHPGLNASGKTRVEAKLKKVPAPPVTLPKPFDPSDLSPGLMVRTYSRTAQQRGPNKFVAFDKLGEPVGKPATTRTFETFTYPADANIAAFGYMRIDTPGSAYFHCPNHVSLLILVDGRPALPFNAKGVPMQFTRKGYVPILIIGYADTREIHLEWLTDASVRTPPPSVFHDPERLKP